MSNYAQVGKDNGDETERRFKTKAYNTKSTEEPLQCNERGIDKEMERPECAARPLQPGEEIDNDVKYEYPSC
jgi:hypothetical protein